MITIIILLLVNFVLAFVLLALSVTEHSIIIIIDVRLISVQLQQLDINQPLLFTTTHESGVLVVLVTHAMVVVHAVNVLVHIVATILLVVRLIVFEERLVVLMAILIVALVHEVWMRWMLVGHVIGKKR